MRQLPEPLIAEKVPEPVPAAMDRLKSDDSAVTTDPPRLGVIVQARGAPPISAVGTATLVTAHTSAPVMAPELSAIEKAPEPTPALIEAVDSTRLAVAV